MFIAKSRTGKIYQGSNWLEIPAKGADLQEVHLGIEGIQTQRLSGMDAYYHIVEAMAVQGHGEAQIVAEIIGGVLLSAEICIEIRMERMGIAGTRIFRWKDFPYDKNILR